MLSEQYLEELADSARPISASKLLSLSGLAAAEVEVLSGFWTSMAEGRRLQIVRQMAEVSDDNPEVDFDEVFRLGLHDADPELRLRAIEALWDCQERWLIAELIELMQRDGSEEVRSTAASHLGKFSLLGELEELRPRDVMRIREALTEILGNRDGPVDVRRRALEAISPFSDDAVNDLIRNAYYSDAPKMRASALYAMGLHCDAAWLPVLLTELKSDSAEMRYEAARSCGQMEDERAVSTLIEVTRDDDAQVCLAAIEALGLIGGRRAKATLKRLAASPEAGLQEAARNALEELEISENPLTMQLGEQF